jgi:hypothetical protein
MKNIIIIKVEFCKTFGTNNVINTTISTPISYLMIWLDYKGNGYST